MSQALGPFFCHPLSLSRPLTSLSQSHDHKYHLHIGDSKDFISNPDLSHHLQTGTPNFLLKSFSLLRHLKHNMPKSDHMIFTPFSKHVSATVFLT